MILHGKNIALTVERVGAHTDPLVIEAMRILYNHSLPRTRTKAEVTANTCLEQYTWFRNMDWKNVIIHVYRAPDEPWTIAGFSILRNRGDYWTPFFATNHIYHGRGIGRAIVEHYLDICPGRLRGEQLTSNAAICYINRTVGWQVLDTVQREVGEVQLLSHPGRAGSTEYPDYPAMLEHWIDSD